MLERIRLRRSAGLYTDDAILTGTYSSRVSASRTLLSPFNQTTTDLVNPELISPETCYYYSPWYRAISLVSLLMLRTPLLVKRVQKQQGGEVKEVDRSHPAFFSLDGQANLIMTSGQVKARMTQLLMTYGTARALIQRKSDGSFWFWPMLNGELERRYYQGRLVYLRVVNLDTDDPTRRYSGMFEADQVLDLVWLFGSDAITPLRPWQLAKFAVTEGNGGMLSRFARARNGGRPALALTTDQPLTEQTVKRIQDDFRDRHAGYENRDIPIVLGSGLKAGPLSYSNDLSYEAQLAKLPLNDVANFTGVPSILLGDTSGTQAALEEQIRNFYQFGMGLYHAIWVDQCKAKCLTEQERRQNTHTIEFDVQSLDWATTRDIAESIRAWGAGTPVMTPNNIRSKLGEPPLDDPEANKLQFPKNIGRDGSNNTPLPGDKPPAGRPRVELDVVIDRIFKQAERKASNEKAYLDFCGRLRSDEGVLAVLTEKVGERAPETLNQIVETLLTIAECPKGQLHDTFHARAPLLQITLPEKLK